MEEIDWVFVAKIEKDGSIGVTAVTLALPTEHVNPPTRSIKSCSALKKKVEFASDGIVTEYAGLTVDGGSVDVAQPAPNESVWMVVRIVYAEKTTYIVGLIMVNVAVGLSSRLDRDRDN